VIQWVSGTDRRVDYFASNSTMIKVKRFFEFFLFFLNPPSFLSFDVQEAGLKCPADRVFPFLFPFPWIWIFSILIARIIIRYQRDKGTKGQRENGRMGEWENGRMSEFTTMATMDNGIARK